jgi:hypothetical protein
MVCAMSGSAHLRNPLETDPWGWEILWGIAVRGYPLPPPPIYAAQGACGKPRVVPHNRRPQARTYGNGRKGMRVTPAAVVR